MITRGTDELVFHPSLKDLADKQLKFMEVMKIDPTLVEIFPLKGDISI